MSELERGEVHLSITPAGESFREHASLVLSVLERAAASAKSGARGESGRLVLRFTLMSTLTAFPGAVARFQNSFPDVALDIQAGGTTEQLDAIAAGRCDIGFVTRKKDLSPLGSELRSRLAGGADRLQRLTVPEELRGTHDLLVSAWRFAETAVVFNLGDLLSLAEPRAAT